MNYVHGGVYALTGVKAPFGVFTAEERGFIVVLTGFGKRPWLHLVECNESGLTKPTELLDKAPQTVEVATTLGLIGMRTRCQIVRDGNTFTYKDTDVAVHATDEIAAIENSRLLEWLHEYARV